MRASPPLPPGFLDRPFAHRGLHGAGAPENSLTAVSAAISAGYGIEVDLQPAADGTPMVFHDESLDRMTHAAGAVADRSPAELGTLSLRGGTGEGVPTLEALLARVAGRVPLLLELKDQSGELGAAPLTLEPDVARLLRSYRGPAAVMSFNPAMVAAVAARAPDLPRGLTTCAFAENDWPDLDRATARRLASIADADPLGAAFISHGRRDLDMPVVAAQRHAGRAVICWTIRSPAEEAAALSHADAITFEGYRPPLQTDP
ncbi:MAG: glycerophosphodiester phosphodiesterase family protein [Pseudomonadota bacterium]